MLRVAIRFSRSTRRPMNADVARRRGYPPPGSTTTPPPHVVGAVNAATYRAHQAAKNGCHCIGCTLYLQSRDAGCRGDRADKFRARARPHHGSFGRKDTGLMAISDRRTHRCDTIHPVANETRIFVIPGHGEESCPRDTGGVVNASEQHPRGIHQASRRLVGDGLRSDQCSEGSTNACTGRPPLFTERTASV